MVGGGGGHAPPTLYKRVGEHISEYRHTGI